MRVELWSRTSKKPYKRLTKPEAYALYPELKEDVEEEIERFKGADVASTKVSYKEGLEVYMERNLDEVKNADKGFQTRTDQIEGPQKKKAIQESCY